MTYCRTLTRITTTAHSRSFAQVCWDSTYTSPDSDIILLWSYPRRLWRRCQALRNRASKIPRLLCKPVQPHHSRRTRTSQSLRRCCEWAAGCCSTSCRSIPFRRHTACWLLWLFPWKFIRLREGTRDADGAEQDQRTPHCSSGICYP